MRRLPLPLLIGCFLVVGGIALYILAQPSRQTPQNKNLNRALPTNTSLIATNTSTANTNATEIVNAAPPVLTNATTVTPEPVVHVPITDFFTRITKKPFGIHITPATSPIQPEKFSGYHTGADAETTSAEQNTDVPIVAIADGTVVFAGHVNGYGGVIMIQHIIGGETVTALYGHLRISSFTKKKGEDIKSGKQIAVLGTGFSSETDGERKHLHFGIIKGANINYKGYVPSKGALSSWEDPVAWLHAQGI